MSVLKKMMEGGFVTVQQRGIKDVKKRWKSHLVFASNGMDLANAGGSVLRRFIAFVFNIVPKSHDESLADVMQEESGALLIRCLLAYHAFRGRTMMLDPKTNRPAGLKHTMSEASWDARNEIEQSMNRLMCFLNKRSNELRFRTSTKEVEVDAHGQPLDGMYMRVTDFKTMFTKSMGCKATFGDDDEDFTKMGLDVVTANWMWPVNPEEDDESKRHEYAYINGVCPTTRK